MCAHTHTHSQQQTSGEQLHDNSTLTYTYILIHTRTHTRTHTYTHTCTQVIANLAQQILSKLPPQFDVEEVATRFPTTYKESMNTVLTQVRHRRF